MKQATLDSFFQKTHREKRPITDVVVDADALDSQREGPRKAKSNRKSRSNDVANDTAIHTVGISRYKEIEQKIQTKKKTVTNLVIVFKESPYWGDGMATYDADNNNNKILDLRGFHALKTLVIREKTGKIRFKELGEEVDATNRFELALPTRTTNLLKTVTFEWKYNYEHDYAVYDGLTEKLRASLHNNITNHLKVYEKVQMKTHSPESLDELKWKHRFGLLKKKCDIDVDGDGDGDGDDDDDGDDDSDRIYPDRIAKKLLASSVVVAAYCNDSTEGRPLVEEGEIVFRYRRTYLDGTVEFNVLEVANASIKCDHLNNTTTSHNENKICEEDRESSWRKKWKISSPKEYRQYQEIVCFNSPLPSVDVTTTNSRHIYRTKPAIEGYDPIVYGRWRKNQRIISDDDSSQISNRSDHDPLDDVDVILRLTPKNCPTSFPCHACKSNNVEFPSLETLKKHVRRCGKRIIFHGKLDPHKKLLNQLTLDEENGEYLNNNNKVVSCSLLKDWMKDTGWGNPLLASSSSLLSCKTEGLDDANTNKIVVVLQSERAGDRPQTTFELKMRARELEEKRERAWATGEPERKKRISFEKARSQVEYYLSDTNLKSDSYYRNKINGLDDDCDGDGDGDDGWFAMIHIMSAPRIKSLGIDSDDLVTALIDSQSVETKKIMGLSATNILNDNQKNDGTEPYYYMIRRMGGKALPRYRKAKTYNSYSSNNRHRSSSYSDRGSDRDYGDCDTLLAYGVKPWDDDADMVYNALHDYY